MERMSFELLMGIRDEKYFSIIFPRPTLLFLRIILFFIEFSAILIAFVGTLAPKLYMLHSFRARSILNVFTFDVHQNM